MPLYELICIARTTATNHLPLPTAASAAASAASKAFKSKDADLANLMKTAGLHILDRGGVVRKFENIGSRQLPYRMRRHQEIFDHGHYWSMLFDASPSTMQSLLKTLSYDERVIRHTSIKVGDSLQKVTQVNDWLDRKTG
ncbi:hypothetical protein HK102_002124, partial [Quaeritorhiza haematococci]